MMKIFWWALGIFVAFLILAWGWKKFRKESGETPADEIAEDTDTGDGSGGLS
jgi:hypothetical protein